MIQPSLRISLSLSFMIVDVKTVIWFIITLLLMGFFSGIEMAFFIANRLGIELKKRQGHVTGQILANFVQAPVRFLGTTLLGFNIFLVFFGLQVENVMRPVWDLLRVNSYFIRLITDIALSTFVVLIFAEFIPRAIFRARSNKVLTGLAYVTDFFYQMFYPLASGLIKLAEWMLKYIFNVRLDDKKEAFSRNDLENLFEQSRDGDDVKQELNTELIRNALDLPNVKLRQCLVPRKEIVGIDSKSTMTEVKKKFIETKLSKLIVYNNDIDHILGYIHQLDLFRNPQDLQTILLPIPAVPESMSATDLISKFTRERKSVAWVVDEFGGTAGIITMEDVLEEIFGEIEDEYDTEEFVEKQISENEFIFSGRLELDYLYEKYDLEFPANESETLSGYIINYHETIPRQKERIIIDNYEFDILNVGDTRIEMVKMKKLK